MNHLVHGCKNQEDGWGFLRDESNLASEGKCKLNDMAAVYFLLLFSTILFYFYFGRTAQTNRVSENYKETLSDSYL